MNYRQLALVLGACMAASAFGIDALAPALADLAADLSIPTRVAQLNLSVAIAGFAAGQIPAGVLADRFGRRQIALVALLVFALAAVAGALSANIDLLLVTRFVQGLCGGALSVASRAMARDVASGSQAAHLMAWITSTLALVTVMAPLVGGAATGLWGWRSVLWIIAGYNLVNFMLGWWLLPSSAHGPQRGETAIRQLQRSFRQFSGSRQSLLGTAINALAFSGLFCFITSGAIVAIEVYHLSATQAGFAMATVPLMLLCGTMITGAMVMRVGLNRMLMWAIALIAIAGAGNLINGLLQPAHFAAAWAPYMCYGLGFGLFMPTITTIVIDPLPASAGFASSIFGSVQAACGAALSFLAALLYDGSMQPLSFLMAACAIGATLVYLISGPRTFVVAGRPVEV